jgi:hypothetical protein
MAKNEIVALRNAIMCARVFGRARTEMLQLRLKDGTVVTLSDEEQQQYGALRRCHGTVDVQLTKAQWDALQREISAPSKVKSGCCDVLNSAYLLNHKELLRKMLPRISDYLGD